MDNIKLRKWGLVLAGLAACAAGRIVLLLPAIYTLLFMAGIIFGTIFILKTRIMLYALILILPLLALLEEITQVGGANAYLSINIGGILNILVTFAAIGLLFLKRRNIFKYKLALPMLAFLGVLMLSILFSPLKFMSLRRWFRYAMPAMVYFIALESFDTREGIGKLTRFTLFCSIPPLLVGFWQLVFSSGLHSIVLGLNRIHGTFKHPNTYAMYLIVVLLLALLLIFKARASRRWLYGIVFITALVLLINTFTRVGWVSFMAALSVIGFLRYRRLYFFFILIGIILMVCLTDIRDMLYMRLQPDSSFWRRFDLAHFGLSLFKQKPILGHGVGSYSLLSGASSGGAAFTKYGVSTGLAPHNDYIRFLSEAGIIGLLAFLSLMGMAMKMSFRIFKSTLLEAKNYGLFLMALITAILVFGITDQGFEYSSFWFWLFLAMGEIYLYEPQRIGVEHEKH